MGETTGHDPGLPPPGQRRIMVIGVSASGKSTLAAELARLLKVKYVEMDRIQWGWKPDWQGPPEEVFREQTDEATRDGEWVLDGNYRKVRDIVWPRATLAIWLDYPLPLVLWRLAKRTIKRVTSKELLWGTNRESLYTHLFTKDSLFLWVLETHPKLRHEYPVMLADEFGAHLKVLRFTTPGETARWLAELKKLLGVETSA